MDVPEWRTLMTESEIATRWYVVANGSRARAYVKRLGESGYDQVREWDEPDARRRDADLGEDKPGRAFAAAGASQRSGMEWEKTDRSPKQHAKHEFVRHLAEDLTAALRAGELRTIALIAPAPVANALRDHLPEDARRALKAEEHHDITSLPTADLFERLDRLRHGM